MGLFPQGATSQLNLFTPNRFEFTRVEYEMLRRNLQSIFDITYHDFPLSKEIAQKRIDTIGLGRFIRVDRVDNGNVHVAFRAPVFISNEEGQKVGVLTV